MPATPITDELVEQMNAAERTLRRQTRAGDPANLSNYLASTLTAVVDAIRKLESRDEQ